jgi:hypothetical protein
MSSAIISPTTLQNLKPWSEKPGRPSLVPGSELGRPSRIVFLWRQLLGEMRPEALHDPAQLWIDGPDLIEAMLELRADISSSSGRNGRPCRNSIGIRGASLLACRGNIAGALSCSLDQIAAEIERRLARHSDKNDSSSCLSICSWLVAYLSTRAR